MKIRAPKPIETDSLKVNWEESAPKPLVIETADDLAPITDGLHKLIRIYASETPNFNIVDYPFPLLDYLMDRFNFENAGILELIAIVRTTFPIKHKLKNWELFRDKAYDKTVSVGKDAERIFKGVL